jgi:hypothetical protein
MKPKILTLALVLLVCVVPVCPVQALEDYTPEAIVTDALIVRPACLVVTIFGAAFFVVTLPISAVSKSVDRTADSLVNKPAHATFIRPLGNFTELP